MVDNIETRDLMLVFLFDKQDPFPRQVLAEEISQMGYDLNPNKNSPIVGGKDNIQINYEQNKGTITVLFHEYRGEHLPDVLDQFEEMLFEGIEADIDDFLGVELQMSCLIWKGESTVSVFDEMYNSMDFEDLLGHPGVGYSFRIVSHEDISESGSDFYDITLEPYVPNKDYYYSMIIYRKPTIEEMGLFVDGIYETIKKIVNRVESMS